MELRS